NENYYAIKMDGEMKTDVVFQGHTFSFVANGRRGYHELPASLLDGKLSYPTTIFMNEQIQIMQRIPGYLDTQTIMPILVYLGEEHFETTPWDEFQEKYKAGEVNP
ncbi:MAG: thioredoxin, partial [Bacteroidota bacterium]